MDADNDTKVILISSDSKTFEISAKAAKRSKLIKESIEDSKEDIIEFQVNNVKSEVLKKVVEYLEHYKDEEPKEIEIFQMLISKNMLVNGIIILWIFH